MHAIDRCDAGVARDKSSRIAFEKIFGELQHFLKNSSILRSEPSTHGDFAHGTSQDCFSQEDWNTSQEEDGGTQEDRPPHESDTSQGRREKACDVPEEENGTSQEEGRHPKEEGRHSQAEGRHPQEKGGYPQEEGRHSQEEGRHSQEEGRYPPPQDCAAKEDRFDGRDARAFRPDGLIERQDKGTRRDERRVPFSLPLEPGVAIRE
ncbi:MAG TPA: hypothetical protein VFX38_00335 [Gammaproteobacteria bacterium]|nr:hypothetical protein [Gammaproteobacteria bacterium]